MFITTTTTTTTVTDTNRCPIKWDTHTQLFFLPLTVASIPWDNNHFRCWASVDFLWRQSNHFHNVRGWKVSLGAGAQFVRHFALLSNNEHIYMWNTSFVSHILLSSRHHLVVVIVMHSFHPLSLTNTCVRLKTWSSFFLTPSLPHSLPSIIRLNPCISCVITLQGPEFATRSFWAWVTATDTSPHIHEKPLSMQKF